MCELGGYSATKLLASSALASNKEMLSVESSGVVLEAKSAVECGGNATRFPADHKSGSSLGHVVRYRLMEIDNASCRLSNSDGRDSILREIRTI